jgi:hypothetical protein
MRYLVEVLEYTSVKSIKIVPEIKNPPIPVARDNAASKILIPKKHITKPTTKNRGANMNLF